MIATPRVIRGWVAALGAGALLAAAATPADAQATGTVSGTVVDNTNRVVPGATVTLVNEATAGGRSTVSGEQGAFTFQAVAPGSYTVKIELTGFRTHEQKNNIVNASGQIDLGPLKLDVGTRQRSRVRRRRGSDDRDEEQRLLRPADVDPDLADPEPRTRRHEPAAAAAGRALRGRHRGDGRQLRLADPQHRRDAASTGTR